MIDIEFDGSHIQKEKESYTFIDDRQTLGGSNTAYKNVDGETVVQRVLKGRTDGYIDRYFFTFLCTHSERAILRSIMTGKSKLSKCRKAILTVSGEGERDTMVNVVGGAQDYYSEKEIIESVLDDNENTDLAEFGYDGKKTLYEINILLIKSK